MRCEDASLELFVYELDWSCNCFVDSLYNWANISTDKLLFQFLFRNLANCFLKLIQIRDKRPQASHLAWERQTFGSWSRPPADWQTGECSASRCFRCHGTTGPWMTWHIFDYRLHNAQVVTPENKRKHLSNDRTQKAKNYQRNCQ